MTDYERTTVRQTEVVEPLADPADPAAGVTAVRTTERASTPAGPGTSATLPRIVVFVFGVLQVALILRVILLLLGANTGNQVVDLILTVTDPFVEPFRGMFSLDRVGDAGGSLLDVAAIVALIGWTLVEALVLALLRIFDRRQVVTV
jgi:uncharacterized protein YggT (Ycf19 family)